MRILLFFLVFFFSSFGAPEFAQESVQQDRQEEMIQAETAPTPLQFDREAIENLKKDPDFDYTEEVEQENWWTRLKRYVNLQWQRFLNWLFGDYRGNSFILFLVELIPYLILAGVFIFAVWLFIRLNPGRSFLKTTEAGNITFNEEEEIVQSRDIRKLIDEAVARGDYRLAVRYSYLLVLQKLTEAGHIEYQFPKTNEDYLAEIEQETIRNQFRQITRIYDFIWYGSFEVTRENFGRVQRDFSKMQELIAPQHEQNV